MLSRSASSPTLQSLLNLDSSARSRSRHRSLPSTCSIGRRIQELHASSSSSAAAGADVALIRRARSENDLRKLSSRSASSTVSAAKSLVFGHENEQELMSDCTKGFLSPRPLSKQRRQRSLQQESIANSARSPFGASRLTDGQDASRNQSPGHSFGRSHSCDQADASQPRMSECDLADSIQPGTSASPEILQVMNGQLDVWTEMDDRAYCITSGGHDTFNNGRADDACSRTTMLVLDRENCSRGSEGMGVSPAHGNGDGSGSKGGGGRRPNAGRGGGRGGADWDSTDMHYQTMIKENPGHPLVLRNYAQYLAEYKHDYAKAEEYYQRAILTNPRDGEVLSQFAKILWDVHRDKERAASYFERAVQAAPEDSHVMAAHASFLWNLEAEEEDHVNRLPSFSTLVSPIEA